MAELLVGIDVGTSGVKTAVFDAAGRLLGSARASHEVDRPRPGWAQSDPEGWWRGIVRSLAAALAEAHVRGDDVAAVGVGVLFPCIVPLDGRGRALHPAILYSDQRSLAQVDFISERMSREHYESIIGNSLVPGTCAATSVLYLRDEQPEAYASARVLGFANTFVTGRLTGVFAADPTHAGLSGLADIRDPWRWSNEVCEALGLDPACLPRIAGSADVIGDVTPSAARETGLRAGTPVICGCGDVPACAVGGGALTPDTTVYIAGSTDCVALPMPGPTGDRRWAQTAYVPRAAWLGIGANTSSGAAVEWFIREFLPDAAPEGQARMTELAASSPPGSGGVLFLPYLQGERTPVWDPRARGMFIGLTSRTTRGDLARAVFEGTAFALRQMVECAGHASEIRAVGGGTRNDFWNQLKADVLQRPLDVLESQEPGTLGAALLAGVGTGAYGSFQEAVALARRALSVKTIAPRAAQAALYDEMLALYSQLYPLTADIVHGLSDMA
jgi:xylulokinase